MQSRLGHVIKFPLIIEYCKATWSSSREKASLLAPGLILKGLVVAHDFNNGDTQANSVTESKAFADAFYIYDS
jgi:hypothetical protein